MNAESRWIITMILVGALLASIVINIDFYFSKSNYFSTWMILVLFIFAILTGPSWSEVDEYWRNKYGK